MDAWLLPIALRSKKAVMPDNQTRVNKHNSKLIINEKNVASQWQYKGYEGSK